MRSKHWFAILGSVFLLTELASSSPASATGQSPTAYEQTIRRVLALLPIRKRPDDQLALKGPMNESAHSLLHHHRALRHTAALVARGDAMDAWGQRPHERRL